VIFTREINDPLTSLVKKIDAAVQKNPELKAFVTVLNTEEGLDQKLKSLAEKEGIKKTPFSIDNPAGPPAYKISKDADVTVLLYVNQTVKANHAFRKGELNEQAVERVVADLKKITSQ
jgi:hypothetical protein